MLRVWQRMDARCVWMKDLLESRGGGEVCVESGAKDRC